METGVPPTGNRTVQAANGRHQESMEIDEKPSTGPSRVSVHSGVAKRAKEKGLIVEQDIGGLEYSSEEEANKPVEDFEDIFAMSNKKSKAVSFKTSLRCIALSVN